MADYEISFEQEGATAGTSLSLAFSSKNAQLGGNVIINLHHYPGGLDHAVLGVSFDGTETELREEVERVLGDEFEAFSDKGICIGIQDAPPPREQIVTVDPEIL